MYGQSDLGFHHGTDFHGDFSLNLSNLFSGSNNPLAMLTGRVAGAGQKIGGLFEDDPDLAPSLIGAGVGLASYAAQKRAAEQQAELQAQLYAEQMRLEEARRKATMQALLIGVPLIGLAAFVLIRARRG